MPKTGIEIIYDNAEQLGRGVADNLRLVHRLDKETSGVLVLAKTKQAQSGFSACFSNRLV